MEKRFGKREWLFLILFGLVGQIAWSVENMYFNLFVFETVAPSLSTVTLMVQLSGIVATLTTLVAGTLSDKIGNRRSFISWGYAIWGVTVALFGFLSPELTEKLLGCGADKAITLTLVAVVVGDCVMTLFGSTANDASFNAWVTDNTESSFRGKVEGVLSILPLVAMLIVAGGFGIIVEVIGYSMMFLCLGIVISLCGIFGIFKLKDSPALRGSGSFGDILYGFKPNVIKGNSSLYLTLCLVLVYGIACQIFMPYLIIYYEVSLQMKDYVLIMAPAIVLASVVTAFWGRVYDKKGFLFSGLVAVICLLLGYGVLYFTKTTLPVFIGSLLMMSGYLAGMAVFGARIRDNTPVGKAGRLQGIRIFSQVLIPGVVGPAIGKKVLENAELLVNNDGTTSFVPNENIFLAAGIALLLVLPFFIGKKK